MSQKPFVWNGNNAVSFEDPSGYLLVMQGSTDEQQQEWNDWNAAKASLQNDPQAVALMNDIAVWIAALTRARVSYLSSSM